MPIARKTKIQIARAFVIRMPFLVNSLVSRRIVGEADQVFKEQWSSQFVSGGSWREVRSRR